MEITSNSQIANLTVNNIIKPLGSFWERKCVSLTSLDEFKKQIANHLENKKNNPVDIYKKHYTIKNIYSSAIKNKKVRNHIALSPIENYYCIFSAKPKHIAHEKIKHYELIIKDIKSKKKTAKSVYNPVSKMKFNFNGKKLLFISTKNKNYKIKTLEITNNNTLDVTSIKRIKLQLNKEKIYDIAFGIKNSHLVATAGTNNMSIKYNQNNNKTIIWDTILSREYDAEVVNIAFSKNAYCLFVLLENNQLIINQQNNNNSWSEVVTINNINSLPVDADENGNLLFLTNKALTIINYNESSIEKTEVLQEKFIKITASCLINRSNIVVGIYDKLNGSYYFVFYENTNIGWLAKKKIAAKQEITDIKADSFTKTLYALY
jgi:hypothetical protein